MDQARAACLGVCLGTVLALVSCLGAVPPEAPREAPRLTEEVRRALIAALDAAIEEEMERNFVPGVGLALVHGGETIYTRGYGVANLATGAPVDPDTTIFRIGSISKALSLLTLARLVDDGRVGRGDDVTTWFSDIENEPGFEQPVTVDHLLTHTTGFDQIGAGRQIDAFERPLAERQALRPGLTEFLADRNLRRVSPAGGYFRYDTYGATLAGVILERVTGLSYAEAMEQEMFAPLGMARTSVEVRPEDLDSLASGHGYIDGQYVRTPYEVYVTTPASSIDATVADMGRLLEALTSDGANAHGRFVSEAMARSFRSPQYRPHPEFAGMSHGLWESFQQGRGEDAIPVRTYGHGGDMWGFNSSMTLLPEYDLAFYVSANRNGEGGGPGVAIGRPVMEAILSVLDPGRRMVAVEVPERDPSRDLSAYAGAYSWGVYCHSCTEEELAAGAWPPPRPTTVGAANGALTIRDHEFLPAGGDVFVRSDGYDQVFFRRDAAGRIASFTYQEDPTAYERL